MANPTDPDTDKNEMRVMWIGSAAIVLLILAACPIAGCPRAGRLSTPPRPAGPDG